MFRLDPDGPGRVRLVGRLDAAEAEHAESAFEALSGSIVADCSALEYVSSAGISVIMQTFKRLRANGHEFRLSEPTPRVRNVFVYSGLAKLLGIE